MNTYFTIVFLLIAAHFVADFSLQNDAIATGKNKYLDPAKFGVPWQYWLLSHSFTQGFLVAVLTQNAWLGLVRLGRSHFS